MKLFQSINELMLNDIETIKNILINNAPQSPFIIRTFVNPIIDIEDRSQLLEHLYTNFPIWSKKIFGITNEIRFFSGGLCSIQSDEGKWGYMNTRFQIVLPQIYDSPAIFMKNGLAICSVNHGALGVINKSGKFVIPDDYAIIYLSEDLKKYYCIKEWKTLCYDYDQATETFSDPYPVWEYQTALN